MGLELVLFPVKKPTPPEAAVRSEVRCTQSPLDTQKPQVIFLLRNELMFLRVLLRMW